MSRILVSGGEGSFANQLRKVETKHDIMCVASNQMDVTKPSSIDSATRLMKPAYFIHAGAITRPLNQHEENPAQSIKTNIIGTSNVVLTCMRYHIKLIYLSTDYVYPGTLGAYSEEDGVKPFTKYGWSKLGGECAVQMYHDSLILRLAMINHPFDHPKAFYNMTKNCIWDKDVAKIVLQLLDEKGIINIGGPPMSVYEFVNKEAHIEPIKATTSNLNTSMCVQKMKEKLNT